MSSDEERLLVVAPTGRDAALFCEIVRRDGILCEPCGDVGEACRKAESGAGVFVLAEEALGHRALDDLAGLFSAQPKWSSIPVILLTSDGDRIHAASQSLLAQKGFAATS